jgi:hypothetical protein
MASGRRPPRLRRRRDADKSRQFTQRPAGDPKQSTPIRANGATTAIALDTITKRPSPSREKIGSQFEKCGLSFPPRALSKYDITQL